MPRAADEDKRPHPQGQGQDSGWEKEVKLDPQ